MQGTKAPYSPYSGRHGSGRHPKHREVGVSEGSGCGAHVPQRPCMDGQCYWSACVSVTIHHSKRQCVGTIRTLRQASQLCVRHALGDDHRPHTQPRSDVTLQQARQAGRQAGSTAQQLSSRHAGWH